MKIKFLILFACLICFIPCAHAQEEIVIEMYGETENKTSIAMVSIWKQNCKQLTKLFRKKDKMYVLQAADSIPSLDLPLSNDAGKDYNLIQYGQDTREYRKFLFEADEDQKFIVCASTPADVIAVFQRYGVNMGLRKPDFLKTYAHLKKPGTLTNGTETLTLYTIPETQLPLAGKEPVFAVFNQNKLVQLLNGKSALETYQKTLLPAPQPESQPVAAQPTKTPKARQPYKALLSGGTVEDQMYMPRVISGPFTESTNSKKQSANKQVQAN